MPRQPNVRSNDPNRQKRARSSSSFSALTMGTQEGVASYSQEDPNLVRNETQADVLKVGKTYGGPQGEAMGTQLAKLLNTGMKAVEQGFAINKQLKDQKDRIAAKEDEQVALEYEQEKLDLQNTEQWPTMSENDRQNELRALHNRYEGRYKQDRNVLKWNQEATRFRLEAPFVEANSWYQETVTKGIQEIKLRRLSEEDEANAISDLIDEAVTFANARYGPDNPASDKIMALLLRVSMPTTLRCQVLA